MKRLITIVLFLLIVTGCINESLDLNIGPAAKTPEEIKEEGNPFSYYEYEDKQIPVLTAPLLQDKDYYVVFVGYDTYNGQAEFVPSKYVFLCNTQSTLYGNDGDPIKHEPLVLYVDVTVDGEKRETKLEGYLKNSGNLFVEGLTSTAEDWSREQLMYLYSLVVHNEAYLSINYGYVPGNGGEPEEYWAGFLYDATKKELIDKWVSRDTTDRYSLDEVPEYKHDVVKDIKKIREDLANMYCLDTIEESSDMLSDLGTESIRTEIYRVLDSGYVDQPLSLYVSGELAYLRDFDLTFEQKGGVVYEWSLAKGSERYSFDEDWNLEKYTNNELEVEYSYSDNGIELTIHDLVNKTNETANYEY